MNTPEFVPGTYLVASKPSTLATVLALVTKESGTPYLLGYVMLNNGGSGEYLVPAMWELDGRIARGDNPLMIDSGDFDLVYPEHPGKKVFAKFISSNRRIMKAVVGAGANDTQIRSVAKGIGVTLTNTDAINLMDYIKTEDPDA